MKKTEQVSLRVEVGLPERMKKIKPKRTNIGHVWSCAAEVFLSLPDETRKQILIGEIKDSLVAIVQRIVDERIAQGRAAAEKLLEPRGKKRGRRD